MEWVLNEQLLMMEEMVQSTSVGKSVELYEKGKLSSGTRHIDKI